MTDLDPAWFPLPVPEGAAEVALAALAGDDEPDDAEVTFLDCGAWVGDGKAVPSQRGFGLVCGRTAVLCELSGKQPVKPLTDGPAAEIDPLNRVILALAGPMRFDVTVRGVIRAPGDAPGGDPRVFVLLPETRLPLVPRLPSVKPDLVPDPNKATCACHGPVVTRMLYGTRDAPPRYRAVGAPLSRNPNDWFYWMAETYRAVADDLLKVLDRLSKLPGREAVHVVQLGALCEVWTGYSCTVQSMGWAAFVQPTIVDDLGPEDLVAAWSDKVIGTKSRDATARLLGLPRARRSLLHDDAFEAPRSLVAEPRITPSIAEAPLAFLALRDQKVRFVPAQSANDPGFRLPLVLRAVARAHALSAPVYATAGTQAPCLLRVRYPRRFAESQARYVAVA